MFNLRSKDNNYHILVIANEIDFYSDIIGVKKNTWYVSDIYSFRDVLQIDNLQLIEDKILSYGAKYDQNEAQDIYYYFEDKEQGQKLVDELNILLKLVGEN